MPVESGDYLDDLDQTQPLDSEARRFGAGYLRFIKKTLVQSFPNITGAVNLSNTELNVLDELNPTAETILAVASLLFTISKPLLIRKSDNGATAGPTLSLERISASAAASDELAELLFKGYNAAGTPALKTFARLVTSIIDATDTSEDGRLTLQTMIAGTLADRLHFGHGLYTPSVTGGDKGANSINAGALYQNGARIPSLLALTGYIQGWTYANNAGDATNDIDIAAGSGVDSTGVYWISGSALTKQLDAAWAVGTAAGGLDTGAIANSRYYIWAIARSDTGVVDYLFSLSPTAPTMPANYDYKRLIGWIYRESGVITQFRTYELAGGGLDFQWHDPAQDVNLANTLTTTRRTDVIRVPTDFSVLARIAVYCGDASNNIVYITNPDMADTAPSNSGAPLFSNGTVSGTAVNLSTELTIRTSSTGAIAARSNTATTDIYIVSCRGFHWSRR